MMPGYVAILTNISMVKKYLKSAVERRIVIPPHPHYSRSVVIDDVVTSLNTHEDTPYDLIDLGSPVSVSDQIKAGLSLRPMGSRPDSTGLEAAHVAAAFVDRFNSLADPETPAAFEPPAVPETPAASDLPSE
ncbi:MAG: hypothetical protein J6S67_02075 [Methanobrevibacter sp.]|nr:hypothetical protein [Methanobrevibacter sp.]